MPYLKFASRKERDRASDIEINLAYENGGIVHGFIATIRDDNHGMIDFYSKEPYIDIFEKIGIKYEIIPHEQISADYAEFLRKKYPEFLDKL